MYDDPVSKCNVALERATRLKTQGTEKYEAKDFEMALELYRAGLNQVPQKLLEQLCFLDDKLHFRKLCELRKQCMLNIVLCYLQLKKYPDAVRVSNEVPFRKRKHLPEPKN